MRRVEAAPKRCGRYVGVGSRPGDDAAAEAVLSARRHAVLGLVADATAPWIVQAEASAVTAVPW